MFVFEHLRALVAGNALLQLKQLAILKFGYLPSKTLTECQYKNERGSYQVTLFDLMANKVFNLI